MTMYRAILITAIFFTNVFIVAAQDEVAAEEPVVTSEAVPEPDKSVGNQLGGHFGVVHGLITISKGKTSNIADSGNYAIGFPTGVTIKTCDKFAFDIEFVPFIDEFNNVNLLFHPGVLFPLGGNFTFGTRAAFEINNAAYGFTPLLNKAFPCKSGGAFFVELVVPVRFFDTGSSTTIGLHLGVGF